MNKESVFDLAVVNGGIVTMSKEFYEEIKKDLQAYKDDNETMAITIRDLNQSHFKILNDLKVHKDKEDKLREIFKDYNVGKIPSGLSQCTYEITVEEMKKILQILNEGDK